MASITVRDIPDDVHRALESRARSHGRSTEAEIRDILQAAALAADDGRLGTRLAALGRDLGLSDDEVDRINAQRDREPGIPPTFE